MRLTTDRENIAQAEAEARKTLDLCDALFATPGKVILGEFVGRHFVRAPMTSRETARERLRCIVLQDREVCPAWRWVPVTFRQIAIWNGFSIETVLAHALKRAFRWERRR